MATFITCNLLYCVTPFIWKYSSTLFSHWKASSPRKQKFYLPPPLVIYTCLALGTHVATPSFYSCLLHVTFTWTIPKAPPKIWILRKVTIVSSKFFILSFACCHSFSACCTQDLKPSLWQFPQILSFLITYLSYYVSSLVLTVNYLDESSEISY
jgi:hypothetical protein